VNTALRRLATVTVVMFLVLLTGTTWVQFGQASALNNDPRNVRTLYGSPRGPIVVAGQSVALSTAVDDPFGYQRSYPAETAAMYSAVTGFYSIVNGGSQLERAMNSELTGQADSLFWSRMQDLITGRQPQGSSIELTLDPAAQQAAWDALGGQNGAVVAIEPSTGRILAMVSTPGFDPNALATHDTSAATTAYQQLLDADGDPLLNKATSQNYPPGSTFKLVTAAAALESGQYTADTVISAPDTYTPPGTSRAMSNFGGSSCSSSGQMSLSDALRISCNTAFAELGVGLGDDALREQAEKFGFDADEDLTIPMKLADSVFPADLDQPQTAQSAIGQYSVRATPVQMAMVAAAIANGGTLMTPYLVDTVRTADLDVVSQTEPSEYSQAVSASTAQALTSMMLGVVQSGSGTAAQISGVQVAGKTGTAQTVSGENPHAWFTGFAPADNPQVAVAVIVEHGGDAGSEATGGKVAAPIARAVMQAVIGQ
jgi:peptidoglycan glycosyltransferase